MSSTQPSDATTRRAAGLLPDGRLHVYEGAPHGLPSTHKDRLNAGLLAFLKSWPGHPRQRAARAGAAAPSSICLTRRSP